MISTHELARLCGVSQGTVDRVLHNRPGVSEATRRKVMAAAEKHGYQPHPAARELLTGERRVVGAIVPAVNNFFFMDLMSAIGERLMAQGLRFFVTPVRNPVEFLDVVKDFAARRTRAILAAPPEESIAIPAHVTDSVRVITVAGRTCRGKNVVHVDPDEVETGRAAARYLLERGHRRIVHVTYGSTSQARRRQARGYREALSEVGITGCVIRVNHDAELEKALRRYAPTAVFCHNDSVALWTIRVLQKLGLRVPEDVSVMGADSCPTFVGLRPGLTSLAYPFEDVAACVTSLVLGSTELPIRSMGVVEGETVESVSA